MASINTVQNQQVTYIAGVTSSGTVASESFWTWAYDTPPTYTNNFQSKWGAGTAGTPGTITYAFQAASNWTATEKAGFVATMDLWSAIANVTFTEVSESSASSSGVLIERNNNASASGGGERFFPGTIGTTNLGRTTAGGISIDADSDDFGPIGASLGTFGGFPWLTLVHEVGHVLGLGHGGPYNVDDVEENVYGIYDSLPWTIMSYNDEGTSGDGQSYTWGTVQQGGFIYQNVPTTWMPLDIVAVQRLYGVAANTPLSGGQTYGFNTNITGNIAKFFDFTQNTRPIITLWNKGVGNTLDVSGFSQNATINMNDGEFSSVGGSINNIAIAFGTRIDQVIAGSGADMITANNNSNDVLGGAGADVINGGTGNDHLYGGGRTAVAGDGADTISAGAGGDYLQGNAGDDQLDGGSGSDRIQGGQGNDNIVGGTGNDTTNGNLGNDTIAGNDGNDSLRGGQGNDSIAGGADNDVVLGDLGTDTLSGGTGIDFFTGGGDADLFVFANGDATFATFGNLANMTDAITDFVDGTDRIDLAFLAGPVTQGGSFATFSAAASAADQMLSAGNNAVIVTSVANDTYLFYENGLLEAIKLTGFTNAAAITAADFT